MAKGWKKVEKKRIHSTHVPMSCLICATAKLFSTSSFFSSSSFFEKNPLDMCIWPLQNVLHKNKEQMTCFKNTCGEPPVRFTTDETQYKARTMNSCKSLVRACNYVTVKELGVELALSSKKRLATLCQQNRCSVFCSPQNKLTKA